MTRCGGYILGFRVDPAEQLQTIFQEVQSLHTVFSKTPLFGVDFANEEKAPPLAELRVASAQDDVEFVDTEAADSIAAYYAEGNKHADHEVVLSPQSRSGRWYDGTRRRRSPTRRIRSLVAFQLFEGRQKLHSQQKNTAISVPPISPTT